MKIFKYSYIFILAFLTFGCLESEDKVTANAVDAGVVVDNDNVSGKALGLPNPDSTISFQDVAVNFRMEYFTGDESRVASYRVVKSFSGENGSGQVDINTYTELPFEFSLSGINELLEGITGVTETDLRLGDVFTFTTYVTTTDGKEYQYAPGIGSLAVTVNCLSDLAGKYSVTGTSTDVAYTDTYPGEITETAPGQYYFIPTSADLTTRRTTKYAIATVFNDVCGTLEIPAQGLGGDVEASSNQFSNEVVGTGSVDPNTGVITFEYTIAGLGGQVDVFTPIN